MKKSFTREQLEELIDNPILNEIVDQRRWVTVHRVVFKFEDKHYEWYYDVGSTEVQDQGPFDYIDFPVECDEVQEQEVLVKQWIVVP